MKTTSLFAIVAISAASAHAGLLYEPANYAAQDNLVVNFDGIRNAGLLKAHDASATTWKNIGRAANDAVGPVKGYKVETWNGSAWVRSDGGNGNSYTYSDEAGKIRLTWNSSPIAFMVIVR